MATLGNSRLPVLAKAGGEFLAVDYWDGRLYSAALLARLRRLSGGQFRFRVCDRKAIETMGSLGVALPDRQTMTLRRLPSTASPQRWWIRI
jgi:hypothetical protein